MRLLAKMLCLRLNVVNKKRFEHVLAFLLFSSSFILAFTLNLLKPKLNMLLFTLLDQKGENTQPRNELTTENVLKVTGEDSPSPRPFVPNRRRFIRSKCKFISSSSCLDNNSFISDLFFIFLDGFIYSLRSIYYTQD